MVNSYRDMILSGIQGRIYEKINPSDMQRRNGEVVLEQLLGIYSEIKNSSNNSLPFKNVVEFTVSFTVSVLLSLSANIDLLTSIFSP